MTTKRKNEQSACSREEEKQPQLHKNETNAKVITIPGREKVNSQWNNMKFYFPLLTGHYR